MDEDFQGYERVCAYPSGNQSTLIFCANGDSDLTDFKSALCIRIFYFSDTFKFRINMWDQKENVNSNFSWLTPLS